ncbi:hypothetical protein [Cetobacterium sp.]|uniref:hypothetical protein n=1 Tax=Cetobacterium sp. TaxID=2071632 RepID=UPI003F350AB3
MPLSPTDLQISIAPFNKFDSSIFCVVGYETTIKIKIKNLNPTDPIYNVGVKLTLPDGVSYVSSSLIEDSNVIDLSYNDVINFYSVTDLYPNSIDFELNVTIKADQHYRSNNTNVSYGHIFAGIGVSCRGDSRPRGDYTSGNTKITSISTFSMTALRYSSYIIAPLQVIKGAGTLGSDNASDIYTITIQIQNTIVESSNISLALNLANGFRYIGAWSASGSNSSNFNSPVITNPTAINNFVSLSLTNKTLSAGGLVIITFQIAVWNKYTIDGIQNSGSIIPSDISLTSSINLTGNLTSFYNEFSIKVETFIVDYICENIYTDALMENDYVISYSVSSYTDIYDVSLTFNIPDGMSYKSDSSTLTPTTIIDLSTLTQVIWDITTISSNTDNTIRLSTITNDSYALISPDTIANYVYSTDFFTTELDFNYSVLDSGLTFSDESTHTIMCEPPILTTSIVNYLYADFTEKPFDVASVDDYVRIGISYDASFIEAKQNVTLFDFPPYNLDVSSVQNIVVTGDFPSGGGYFPIPDNGARIDIGELNSHSAFQIQFDLQVGHLDNDGYIYNLAKGSLINTENLTYALMDASAIAFGTPHLKIDQFTNSNQCINLNKSLIHYLTISNDSSLSKDFLTDAFNLSVVTTIPDIFTIDSITIAASNIDYSNFNSTNNIYTFTIDHLPPYSTLTVTGNLHVNTTPIMSKSYPIDSSTTNGTSQPSTSSFHFDTNEFPLTSELNLAGCSPTIYKTYLPNKVKLLEEFGIQLTVTFPVGCIAYNTKIKDSLTSTDSTNVNNILLNGQPASPSIATNNLILPIADTTNTASGTLTYTLTYNNTTTTIVPTNYSQTLNTTSSIDWAEFLYFPETYSSSYNSSLQVVVPGLNITKSQSNLTDSFIYDTHPIFGEINDLINYKLSITNVGKSPAYQVNIIDTLPHNLAYISNDSNGTFNLSTNKLIVTVPSIDVNETKDVIINTRLSHTPSTDGVSNTSYIGFKENDISSMRTLTSTSNSTFLYSSLGDVLEKYQRNVSLNENFTQNTDRCSVNQIIEYKLVMTNSTNSNFTNFVVTDTFPDKFNFVDNDPFSGGTISINNNILTINIGSFPSNTSLILIYRVVLTSSTVSLESSSAVADFNFQDNINNFSFPSNILYLRLSEVGRGFLFY